MKPGSPRTPVRDAVELAAERLIAAARSRTPCDPVRDLIGPVDTAAAYAVQGRVTASRLAEGARVIGRKTGLTSPSVQRQLGVDQPDFGTLFDDMCYQTGATIEAEALLQPKAEGEIAFVLAQDVVDIDIDASSIRSFVAYALPALEIVDSRIAGWDIRFADTVADNASSGVFVLGQTQVTLEDVDPVAVTMAMSVNGVLASSGAGDACLGDPLNALAWLARTAVAYGNPLRSGQIVLSGALGPMVDIRAGDHISVDISGLGVAEATLSRSKQ
ncbi:2-keto-4-pentenoate hydratase [Nocardioides sp. LHG3406-4]|uniref:2-keto-4-pentenoate hydratase n=1 Tax=Nocardioides sp. LHG3406-4 TaxID=2804575 RepID=UPI003CECB280